ncbi:DNA alkylation repair protein [Anaerocolumna sp. MB42-C2]|uniref:DNA alkylation repair protein n=1 Tax=Anaerocolumna sp. MB42-C2 TaxID=3070997 RepID=UPI0027E1E912|nr:DNA alkylation repair protein [Anaerocolumna sp. MB42-C2]WMJ87091.1 DNA alkylation repair protein [Anaerocolumna sp. MB42-C2]
MADALKDIYTEEFIQDFGKKVKSAYSDFPREKFEESVLLPPWEELPLRARMHRIAESLGTCLPSNYQDALNILFSIEKECTGFPYLFFPDFVAAFGQNEEHLELSMDALKRFTKLSSSEFAIRPFILLNTEFTMKYMQTWSSDTNEHVRRLSSEGCRPRLPWSMDLPMFKKDPAPILKILENLKADPSLYVRKSVANNLNDIAKDHPEIVINTVKQWIGKNPDTDWILRQGCRTLIRKANPEALTLFGYSEMIEAKPLYKSASLTVRPEVLAIGDGCELTYSIDLDQDTSARIRIEYGIDFIKSNGRPSRKLFLLTDKTVSGKVTLTGSRKHSFADLTTRSHYPGIHQIVLLINGQEAAKTTLTLNV